MLRCRTRLLYPDDFHELCLLTSLSPAYINSCGPVLMQDRNYNTSCNDLVEKTSTGKVYYVILNIYCVYNVEKENLTQPKIHATADEMLPSKN